MSSYVRVALSSPTGLSSLIPGSFPRASFRHSCIYVNATPASGRPGDLVRRPLRLPRVPDDGARSGSGPLPVGPLRRAGRRPTYVTAARRPRTARQKDRPRPAGNFRLEPVSAPEDTLAQMLAERPHRRPSTPPQALHLRRAVRVKRLFPDYVEVERAILAQRRASFPIIACRRNPPRGLPMRTAGIADETSSRRSARRQALLLEGFREDAALKRACMPWFNAQCRRDLRDPMGDDFWPYGVEKNRHVLDVVSCAYHRPSKGLSPRKLDGRRDVRPENPEGVFVQYDEGDDPPALHEKKRKRAKRSSASSPGHPHCAAIADRVGVTSVSGATPGQEPLGATRPCSRSPWTKW